MAQKTAVVKYSLTTAFKQVASSDDKVARRTTKDASNKRNKENQRALGAWHNSSRGKMTEVPMPQRRSN